MTQGVVQSGVCVCVCVQNLRVRMVRGAGLALSFGKLPGSLCSKYMLVDGEKVMFGSYRLAPHANVINANILMLM